MFFVGREGIYFMDHDVSVSIIKKSLINSIHLVCLSDELKGFSWEFVDFFAAVRCSLRMNYELLLDN